MAILFHFRTGKALLGDSLIHAKSTLKTDVTLGSFRTRVLEPNLRGKFLQVCQNYFEFIIANCILFISQMEKLMYDDLMHYVKDYVDPETLGNSLAVHEMQGHPPLDQINKALNIIGCNQNMLQLLKNADDAKAVTWS
jgi:hypothetical protein